MAKDTKPAAKSAEEKDFKVNNLLGDKAIVDAMAEIDKEKDEKKKNEAKTALGCATYHNAKTRAELRARRREDDITKEKLDGTKKLLERLIGVETEIKDGCLVPTKTKIADDQRLTPTEYKEEKRKLADEISKKISESNKQLRKDLEELRHSYEGRYEWWWED